jgi:hypothetical protein
MAINPIFEKTPKWGMCTVCARHTFAVSNLMVFLLKTIKKQ